MHKCTEYTSINFLTILALTDELAWQAWIVINIFFKKIGVPGSTIAPNCPSLCICLLVHCIDWVLRGRDAALWSLYYVWPGQQGHKIWLPCWPKNKPESQEWEVVEKEQEEAPARRRKDESIPPIGSTNKQFGHPTGSDLFSVLSLQTGATRPEYFLYIFYSAYGGWYRTAPSPWPKGKASP